jgi:hypothetical protein
MYEIVYHSYWEMLIRIGLELECPKCQQIEEAVSIFEYNNQPLMEYVRLICETPLEYCRGMGIYCNNCWKGFNVLIVRNIREIKYIQPVTRMKKIRLKIKL